MVCTNLTKLNGLVEIIAGGKEFFVRKLTIISLILFNGTVSSGTQFFECQLCQICFHYCEVLHEVDIYVIADVINKHGASPYLFDCQETSHLRYQAWLS
jgi:hypothetical protein